MNLKKMAVACAQVGLGDTSSIVLTEEMDVGTMNADRMQREEDKLLFQILKHLPDDPQDALTVNEVIERSQLTDWRCRRLLDRAINAQYVIRIGLGTEGSASQAVVETWLQPEREQSWYRVNNSFGFVCIHLAKESKSINIHLFVLGGLYKTPKQTNNNKKRIKQISVDKGKRSPTRRWRVGLANTASPDLLFVSIIDSPSPAANG